MLSRQRFDLAFATNHQLTTSPSGESMAALVQVDHIDDSTGFTLFRRTVCAALLLASACTDAQSPLASVAVGTAALELSRGAPCAALEGKGLARRYELAQGHLWIWPAFPRAGEEVHLAYDSVFLVDTSWTTTGVDVRMSDDGWAHERDVTLSFACTGAEGAEVFAGELGAFADDTALELAIAHHARAYWGQPDTAWFNNGGGNFVVGVGDAVALSGRTPADEPPVFVARGNLWTAPEGCVAGCDLASFWVDLSVANLAYDKHVGLLWSLDGWKTHEVALASFEHGALDGGREQWGVDVTLPEGAQRDSVVELAAFTTMAGQSWLDPRGQLLRHTSGRIVHVSAFPDILHDQADTYVSVATDPPGVWSEVTLRWTEDDGPEQRDVMRWSGAGAYDQWLHHLGAKPAGTVVRYSAEARHIDGSLFVDDNDGAGYLLEYFAPASLDWVGNARHWPENGSVAAGGSLWFNVESSPPGHAFDAELRFRVDDTDGHTVIMTREETPRDDKDHFWFRLDEVPAGAHIQYAIQVRDRAAGISWQNNGGADYHAWVND